jgi:hypothetical protein
MTVSAPDVARENVKIYNNNRIVYAITEFSTNVVRAWTSWYGPWQQQFFKQEPTFFSGNAFFNYTDHEIVLIILHS